MVKVHILFILVLSLYVITCKNNDESKNVVTVESQGRKVLIVHSYHSTSRRVMEHNSSIERILKSNGIEYDFFYMDTQRNKDESLIKQAALNAKKRVEEYKPEVIITFDDNAFKYLIMEYYKDSEINVIFAGLDWDISAYDAPYSNTTGMISVTLMEQLIKSLTLYSEGDHVAWLGYNTLTSQKETNAYLNVLGIEMDVFFVETVDEWKNDFLKIQEDYNILIHSGTLTSLNNWNEDEVASFVSENIKVPVGTVNKSIMHCSILGLVVVPTEQGEWVANRAIDLINGKKISDIPVTRNKEGEVYLNLGMAEKLNIIFESKIIKNAHLYKSDEIK